MINAGSFDKRTPQSINSTSVRTSNIPGLLNPVATSSSQDSIEEQLNRIRIRVFQIYLEMINPFSNKPVLQAELDSLFEQYRKLEASLTAPPSPSPSTSPDPAFVRSASTERVIYNCAIAKEAYFSPNQSLMNDFAASRRGDNYVYSSNTPSNMGNAGPTGISPGFSAADPAMQLWNNAIKGSKGLIQTWLPPDGIPATMKENNYAAVDSVAAASYQRAGMRFMYNPEQIGLSYGQTTEADPLFIAAGKGTALPFAAASSSTIAIQIPINRMFDMKYASSSGFKSGVRPERIWTGQVPTAADMKAIYNRGTMYDIEFLLQAMFPISKSIFKTQFRGETLDIGFLGNFPVEMHLGKTLRYVAQIVNLTVTHTHFDNRMVPVYSVVNITAARIPDYAKSYASSTTSNTSGPAALNWRPFDNQQSQQPQ